MLGGFAVPIPTDSEEFRANYSINLSKLRHAETELEVLREKESKRKERSRSAREQGKKGRGIPRPRE